MTLWILLITTPCLPLKTLASAFITDHLRCLHQSSSRMSEQKIQQEIRLTCSTGDTRLWRNNTGTLRDQHGRPVQFGLCKGSADLIGYRSITITPDIVGQQVAVFLSIEVKTPTGRIRPEQQAWLETVQA